MRTYPPQPPPAAMHENSPIIPVPWQSMGFWFALVLTAILAGAGIGSGKWMYVAALALLPFLWFWPVQTAMGMFAMIVPFEGLTRIGGTTVIWFVGLLAGGTLLQIGISGHRLCRPPRTALWWLLLLFWSAASTLWAVEPAFTLQRLPTVASLVIFYLVAVSFRVSENEFEWIARLAILGGCLTAGFLAYEYFAGINWATGVGSKLVERGTLIMGEAEVNPDSVGLKFIIPVSLAVASFLSARSRLARLVSFCALALTVFALLLTMSRAAFVALIVLIVIFARSLRLDRRLWAVGLLAAVLLAAMPATFFHRLAEAGSTGGAGRLDIWRVGLEMARHHPFLGVGLGNFPVVYKEYAGYAPNFQGFLRYAHNVYLDLWTELGILGVVLFFIAVRTQLKIVGRAMKNTRRPKIWAVACEAAFCAILVYAFFMSLLWDKAFWLSEILLAFAITGLSSVDQPTPGTRDHEAVSFAGRGSV
jgi:O-antigen ligase